MQDHAIKVPADQRDVSLRATKENRHEMIVPQHTFSDTALITVAFGARAIRFCLTDRQRFAIALHFNMYS